MLQDSCLSFSHAFGIPAEGKEEETTKDASSCFKDTFWKFHTYHSHLQLIGQNSVYMQGWEM